MNPFMLPAPERISAWGVFRDSLPALPEDEQINKVAEFWSQCPYSNWTLDPDNPKEWLSVWEMLHEGEYCRNAIAVGMEATLRWSGWDASRLEMVMIRNITDNDRFLVVKIDGKYVINYSYAETKNLSDVEHGIQVLYSYRWAGRSYKKSE